jgi:hypothetical protein
VYEDGGHGVAPSSGMPRDQMLRFLRNHLQLPQP